MVVADKLRLCFELVDVCNSLSWRRLLSKELLWWAVATDCLGIVVFLSFFEWNPPQLCLVAAPASEDDGSCDCDF